MILIRLVTQTIFLALGQIWVNKVRSILTTLGIIIGVASIIAVVAALDGLKQSILNEFETFGTKKVFMDGRVPQGKWGVIPWITVQLKEEEVREIVERSDAIEKITPIMMGGYAVRSNGVTKDGVSVQGIWPSWHEIENRYVLMGRPFSSIDEEEHLQVCLINEKAIEELALDKDPVNSFIEIKGRRFLIIGVVETKDVGAMFGGGDTQSEVFVPLSTARNLNPTGWINYAIGQLKSADVSEDAKAEVKFILRQMRRLKPEEEDTFEVQVMQEFIEQFNKVASVITAGAGGIVGISLLVGGIGIMNIMLVSVSERTREIGLRKAVGARPMVVLTQFLVEAVVLCLVGGAVGLGIGQALIFGVSKIPDAPLKEAAVPMWAVGLAVGFSAATGVIFGMFPAMKAARLDPIVALRHE